MDSTFSWFSSDLGEKYTPDSIITTDDPTRRQWRILSIKSDRNEKNDGDTSEPSMASIRMSCSEVGGPAIGIEANVRVYIQVPINGTEFETPQQRGQQAKDIEPKELEAFRKMSNDPQVSQFTPTLLGWRKSTQRSTRLVPGGFHTIIAWETVPGVQLGTRVTTDEQPFWSLDGNQRQAIRQDFKRTFEKMGQIGILLTFPSKRNLVWDNAAQKLWWVDFRDCDPATPVPWSDVLFAAFGLVEPSDGSWSRQDWNRDTSNWRF